MQTKLKSIITAAFALATSFIIGSAWALTEAKVITTSDLKNATWSEAGVADIGGWTVSLNGNTLNADGTISISQEAAAGVTVHFPAAVSQYTVLMKYSDYTRAASNYTALMDFKNSNSAGAYVGMLDDGKARAFYVGMVYTSFNTVIGAGSNTQPVPPAAGMMGISYKTGGSGLGSFLFSADGTFKNSVYKSGITWSGSTISDITLGGLLAGQSHEKINKPASLKISGIAIFTDYAITADDADALAAYEFRTSYVYSQGTASGWGGNCNYNNNLNAIKLPETAAAPAGTKVEVTKLEIAQAPKDSTDDNRPKCIAIIVDGKKTVSEEFVSGGTIPASGGNNPVKLTYNFPKGCVLTVGTQATIKWLKADGSEITTIRYAASNDATGRFLLVNNGSANYSPIALLYGKEPADDTEILAVNFRGDSGKIAAGSSETVAGVVTPGEAYYNDTDTATQSNPQTVNAYNVTKGAATGASAKVTWSSKNTWKRDSATSQLLKGYLDDGNDGVTVNFTDIPFEAYDVIVVSSSDNGTGFKPVKVNGQDYTFSNSEVVKGSSNWGVPQNALETGKNVIRIYGVTGSTLEIKGNPGESNATRAGIGAVILVKAKLDYIPAEISGDNIKISDINALPALEGIGSKDKVKLTILGSGAKTLTFDEDFNGGSIEVIYDGALNLLGPAAPIDFAKYNFDAVATLDYGWLKGGSGMAINFGSGSGQLGDNEESQIPGMTLYGKCWNNTNNNSGKTDAKMFGSDGNTVLADTMPFTWSNNKANWSWGTATTPFLRGYLDDGGTMTFNADVPFGCYDVLIICATDSQNLKFCAKEVNGVKYSADANGEGIANSSATWGMSRNLTPIFGQNILRVSGLTDHKLTINAPKENNGRACIAAILIVKQIPKATATLTEPTDWSDIVWDGVEPSGEILAEITFDGGSLNIDENIACPAINFKGAAIVSAGEFTYPAIDASQATSLEVAAGAVDFVALPSGNVTIAEDATLNANVSSATTIKGIAGAGTFVKTGTAKLSVHVANTGDYAVSGTTVQIDQGRIVFGDGSKDPLMSNPTFIIGENGSLENYGWFTVNGTLTIDSAFDKTIFTNTNADSGIGGRSAKLQGSPAIVKKGAGVVTICSSEADIPSITVQDGSIGFNGTQPLSYASNATFDFTEHDKTSAAIAGNFTFADTYTFKFPDDWASGENFQLCSGTLSGIPEGGKIEEYQFYLGDTPKTATFNLSSNGSVFYNYGVKQIAPEGDYAISTLNGEEIPDGYSVALTMKPGATLTIDTVAKTATSVLCSGILIIEGADGAEPTAEQLAALNFDGVTGKIVKKWLAMMGVININLNADDGKFPEGDTSDDGMLAGNTPKSSWINTTGETGSLTDITEWKTLTQESAEVSGMTFTWDANTTWEANATIPVRGGYLDDGKDNGVTLTLAGVPYEMYDIIVYFSTDQGGGLYQPMTVNGIAYTGDKTEKATVLGNAAWGDNAVVTSVDEGVNALRVRDLAGEVTIHTAKRNSSTRGCVAAIQIVEVPTKEYRSSYEAAAGEDVTTSSLNTYIAGGDPYTGPFTLTLNGGKFIADTDFVCSALAINSATDLTIEKAESYEIPATEIAKIAINEFGGDKITYVNLPTIPATAPAEGKTYRWEGTEPLLAIPFAGTAVAGTLEIACPVANGDKVEIDFSHKSYVFENGFSLTAQQFIFGNKDGAVQSFTQNGGTITLTKEYTGSDTTTAMPFLLAHWPSTCTYDLVGGSIIAENGNVMFGRDGTIAMTVGGGDTTATFKARGVSRNGRNTGCSLTIAENGILQLGVGGIDFVNSDAKKVVLAGGKIEIYDDATIATTAAAEVTDDSTIEIAADKTLTLATTFTGTGTITFTGTGTLNLGTTRPDFSKFDFGENVKLVFVESVADDGVIDISGLSESQISLLDTEGNPKAFTLSGGKMTYTPSVAGKAAWLAYEFEGNLSSSGSDTSALSRDGSDFGPDASLDFKDGTALYTGTHPYHGITYPSSWTCALFGTLPQYQNAVLVTFGTTGGGLIGLATGDPEKNEVLLVRTTGNKKFEVVSTMTVPNAFTAKNLYAFVKDGNTINVYLNGMKWGRPYTADAINFGGGIQIASVHGGVGSTQLVRFDKALFGGDIDNEILRASVIDSMRLYKAALGPNAMAALAEEFKYISPNGSFERTVAEAEENWVAEDAWTKVGEEGAFEKPADNSSVTITTGAADTALTINLDGTVDYEALTFNGTGTLTLKKGTGLVVNNGQTKVNAPIVIEYGAAEITGGPTFINGNGKILFDYSAYPIDEVFGGRSIQLTGLIDEQDDGIVDATFPEDLKGRTMEIVYEAGAYWIKIGVDREPTMLYLTEDTTLDDYTRFALSEGGEATELRLLEDDTIVVPTGKTLTIPETGLAIPAKAVIGAGTIVCDGYLPTTITTLQTTDWTGTLYLKNYNWQSFGFGAYGTADSKIKVTGITGFGPSSTGDGVNPELILEDGDAKALLINNGFSNKDYFFRKVTGSGTFGWDSAATAGPNSGQTYIFKDISDFDGVFDTGAFLKIVVGDTTAGADKGSITFANGITVKTGLGWTAQRAYFGETLTVKGAVGDVLVEGLTTAPDPIPAITLVDTEGNYVLNYAEGKLTIGYAPIEVTIPEVEGATASVEGYTIEGGKIVIPYNTSFTLVYTADDGKLFTDGKNTKSFEFTDVTEQPTIDVLDVETTAAEPTATVVKMEPKPDELADAATFTAGEESKLYAEWNADFIFSADQDIPQGAITLVAIQGGEQVQLEFTSDYEAGTKISVLDMVPEIGGWKMTYPALVQMENFSCGLAVGKLLKTTNVTIDLVLTKDGEDAKTLATYETTILPTVVEVTIPEIANTTVAVTADGEKVEPNDGVADIPYGATLTVTYTLEENFVFLDGTTAAKVLEFANVTEAPIIDVSGIKTMKVSEEEPPVTGDVTVYKNETGTDLVLAATNDGYTGDDVQLRNSVANYESVKQIVIGSGVKRIGNRYFKDFTGLTTVKGGKDLVKFEEKAFYRCMSLEKIELENPAALESLKDAVVYQNAIDAEGKVYEIPSVEVAGYVTMLQGKANLTDEEWENLAPVKQAKAMVDYTDYQFFRTAIVPKTVVVE